MTDDATEALRAHTDLLCCPRCGGNLSFVVDVLECLGCGRAFEVSEGILMGFWPTDDADVHDDVTLVVKEFYEETPFPHYNDFDSAAGLALKAREGIFAKMLDEQVPPGARVIECGCGTGQFSNFLSMANRTVFATDMCVNSLRLGQAFARTHHLDRVRFVQMNLFRPMFKPGTFDLVISNGVLLTTFDPFLGFESIGRLVKPGGHILIGLYHKYGRLITDARRVIFRHSGGRFRWLDPNLRNPDWSQDRKRAWYADQYLHPNETKHTIGDVLKWFEQTGFTFIKSIPRSKPFQPITESDNLFEQEEPGNAVERFLVEFPMMLKGSREGGFFTMIGRKN
jgi:SAM-dependent methyltransferase